MSSDMRSVPDIKSSFSCDNSVVIWCVFQPPWYGSSLWWSPACWQTGSREWRTRSDSTGRVYERTQTQSTQAWL